MELVIRVKLRLTSVLSDGSWAKLESSRAVEQPDFDHGFDLVESSLSATFPTAFPTVSPLKHPQPLIRVWLFFLHKRAILNALTVGLENHMAVQNIFDFPCQKRTLSGYGHSSDDENHDLQMSPRLGARLRTNPSPKEIPVGQYTAGSTDWHVSRDSPVCLYHTQKRGLDYVFPILKDYVPQRIFS